MKIIRLTLLSLMVITLFQTNIIHSYTRKDAARHFKATIKGLTSTASAAGAIYCGKDFVLNRNKMMLHANNHMCDLQRKNLALIVVCSILSATMAKSAYDEVRNK